MLNTKRYVIPECTCKEMDKPLGHETRHVKIYIRNPRHNLSLGQYHSTTPLAYGIYKNYSDMHIYKHEIIVKN